MNNIFIDKFKELFNLIVALADTISDLLQRLILWLWSIFSGVFMAVLEFTIDLVKLVLSYL